MLHFNTTGVHSQLWYVSEPTTATKNWVLALEVRRTVDIVGCQVLGSDVHAIAFMHVYALCLGGACVEYSADVTKQLNHLQTRMKAGYDVKMPIKTTAINCKRTCELASITQ